MATTGSALHDHRLEVVALEGAGGHGEVYRARLWPVAGGAPREVALKALHPVPSLGNRLARLRYEALLLARLDDPAIVGHIGMVLLDGVSVLIMEHVGGEDLSTILGHGRRSAAGAGLPPAAAVDICSTVARALDRAAAVRLSDDGTPLLLVHRDIKPANIRVSPGGAVKVLDFGVAKALGLLRAEGDATGLAVGTPSYMPPEQCSDAQARPASDIYALGVVLLEALTGRRLFEGARLQDRVAIHRDARAHDASVDAGLAALAGLPPGLEGLLGQMLQVDPALRPTAATVVRELDRLRPALPPPGLAAWAAARDWPAPGGGWGRLVGRWWLLRDDEGPDPEAPESGSFSLSLSDSFGGRGAHEDGAPGVTGPASRGISAVPIPAPAPVAPASPASRPRTGLALGVGAAALLGVVAALASHCSGASASRPADAPPPVAAPGHPEPQR